jgi:hypothetical protein
MNLDRWHLANRLYPKRTTHHDTGSRPCIGRCGATISANARPPLCRACKLLFDAQVLVDTARSEAAAAGLAETSSAGEPPVGPEAEGVPAGVP